jgi:hypothetical protein
LQPPCDANFFVGGVAGEPSSSPLLRDLFGATVAMIVVVIFVVIIATSSAAASRKVALAFRINEEAHLTKSMKKERSDLEMHV